MMANVRNETDTDRLGYGLYGEVENKAKPHQTK